MKTKPFRGEETSSDYTPPTVFNIAAAFPETDTIIQERRSARRQKSNEWIRQNPGTIFYAALGLLSLIAFLRSSKN